MNNAKQIIREVVKVYLSCKEYLSSNTSGGSLTEAATSFTLDLESILKEINLATLSEEELADLYIIHGIYPVTSYFNHESPKPR